MFWKRLILFNLFILLFSCIPTTKTILLDSDFDSSQVSWFYREGNNTIIGQAFLRTRGGEIRTCAGYEVSLLPVSKYAEERIQWLYGNTEKGFLNIYGSNRIVFVPDPPEYYRIRKKTLCDASGKFKFTHLPDGKYFIVVSVLWEVPYAGQQGGYLMQKVEVKGGEVKEIILTY